MKLSFFLLDWIS